MPKPHVTSTARVKAWRESLQRRAALFDQVDRERRRRLDIESLFCVGDLNEVKAVLAALLDDPLCFRFPREIDDLGCLWRGPAPAGWDQNVAKAALEAFRAQRAARALAAARTTETADAIEG